VGLATVLQSSAHTPDAAALLRASERAAQGLEQLCPALQGVLSLSYSGCALNYWWKYSGVPTLSGVAADLRSL
jgi:hypothetical protein